MKKFIYILLFFITFFITKNVEAMSGFLSDEKVPDMYITISKGENTYSGPISIITYNNNYLYSLDPYSKLSSKVNYAEYNYADDIFNITKKQASRINIIAHYGYDYKDHTDIKWYAITQFLIWKELNPTEIYFTDNDGNKIDEYNSEVEELEKLVDDYYKVPSFANNYYTYTTNSTYELIDENNVLDNFNMGLSGLDISIDNNKLKINTVGTKYSEISFANGSYTDAPSSFFHTTNYDDYQSFFKKGQKEIINFKIKINVVNASLTIVKMDSDSKENITSSDSEYGLYDEKGLISVIKLDETGTGYIDNLKFEKYYLKELKASVGYKIDTKVYEINIINKHPWEYVELYGEKIKANIIINKYYGNKNNYKLEDGAEFELYDANDKFLKIYTTENGQINIELPYGEYYLLQTSGKDGYKFVEKTEFIIDEEKDYIIDLYNDEILYKTSINKFYGENHNFEPEDGAEFEIYNSNDKLFGTYTTVNGKVDLMLPYGNYYVIQTKGKEGYKFIDKTDFHIHSKNPGSLYFYDEIIKPNIIINKYYGEKDNYKLEDGAEFELYDDNDNLLNTYSTINGISFMKLPYGSYYLKQIKGKDGYKLIDKYEFIINEDRDYTINLYNDKIIGNVTINKYYGEKDNYKLESDAEFELYDLTNQLLGTYITNKGKIKLELPYGNYYLKQIKGKDGYKLIEKYEFIIDEEKDYTINLYNDKIYGNVTINKYYGEKDDYILEDNAEFKLYNKSKKLLGIYTTTNGIINLNLPYGEYYITQSKGIEGYKFIDKYEFIVDEEKDYIINLYNDRIYGNIILNKYYGESDNYELEDGAIFELYDIDDNLIDKYTTKNGVVEMKLPYGKYYLKQIKGKEGYKLVDKKIIEITKDKYYVINLYNDKAYKKIEIKKYYGVKDNYKLEDGAEFELYDEFDNLIDTYVTKKGKISIKLPYGKYYLIQIKGKEGYKLTEKKEIIINDDTIENDIINLYDEKEVGVEGAVLIVDVPNTYKKDYIKLISFMSIIIGFIMILIGKMKKTID